MLRTPVIHPDLLRGLASAGHGSLVVFVDANFPASTTAGPNAAIVHLAVRPGLVSATDALDAILTVIPVEQAIVMRPEREGPWAAAGEPEIWEDFRRCLSRAGHELELEPVERQAFYDLVRTPDLALVIVTGEQRLYGNLALRVGVVPP
jgi:L-fucose mutarotase